MGNRIAYGMDIWAEHRLVDCPLFMFVMPSDVCYNYSS